MSDVSVTIKIPCTLSWDMVCISSSPAVSRRTLTVIVLQLEEYDNSGNKNTIITRTVTVTESKTVKGKEYTKDVTEKSREDAQK
jgi:hypothetical protein